MKKRILGLAMALVMALSLLPSAALAAGTFTDVPQGAWYAGDVQKAVDMKLVNGVGNNKFNPTGLLTYSEVVKLAACMHQSYNTGEVTLKNGSPWYSTYVDYAKTNGIITKDYNWTQTVTRAGYMEIFSNALPDTALAPINEVPDGSIPDVAVNHPQAEDIYKLYRAGIVQGTNEQYYCKPDTSITRCEVATILVRMMDVDFRKHFVLIPIERPLGVLTQPKDATLPQSGSVTFTAAAYGGTAPYTYQWYRIPGGSMKYALSDNTYYQSTKTGTLTVKYNTDLGTGDMFYCVITDKAGATVTTSNANLTIGGPLNIKNQPKDIKTTLSGSASFTVTAIGGKEPYTYQWCEILYDGLSVVLSDNDKYSGAKTETLTGCNFTAAADYNAKYYCVVTDASGKSVTSKSATLTLTDAVAPMRITNHPESTSAPLGGSAIFVVAATDGKEPYTYSWRMRTAGGNAYVLHDIADSCIGTNSTTLLVKNLKMADNNAEFFCVVTDATGYWIQSKKATLTITGDTAPLTIITQPKSNSVPLSGTAVFSVAVTGGQPPYTYEWIEESPTRGALLPDDNEYYSGTKTGTLTVRNFVESRDYNAKFYCVIKDANGNKTTSKSATLTITDATAPLTITTHPKSNSVPLSGTAVFSVAVTGGQPPYTYQWIEESPTRGALSPDDNEWYSGTKTGTLTVRNFVESRENNAKFYCVIKDANGNKTTSLSATLTITDATAPLTIYSQPRDASTSATGTVVFAVTATGGKAPYTYQWYVVYPTGGSSPLSESSMFRGTTTKTLVGEGLANYPNAKFYCVVTDDKGDKVTSEKATLTITPPLEIITQPQEYVYGVNATFDYKVAVTGGKAPYTYQWYMIPDGGSTAQAMSDNSTFSGTKTEKLTCQNASNYLGAKVYCVIKDANGDEVRSDSVTMKFWLNITVGGTVSSM